VLSFVRLPTASFDSGGNDANVSSELEDQVVDIRRGHGAQGGQLCRRLLLVEDVVWPIANSATLQMRMGESGTKVGANDYRVDAGRLLLWP
jgi:hypothetical protein